MGTLVRPIIQLILNCTGTFPKFRNFTRMGTCNGGMARMSHDLVSVNPQSKMPTARPSFWANELETTTTPDVAFVRPQRDLWEESNDTSSGIRKADSKTEWDI